MHSNGDNIYLTSYNDVFKVVDKLLESFCSRYEGNLETPMKGSKFFSDSVMLMYYTCHKVVFRRGGVYIDFSD